MWLLAFAILATGVCLVAAGLLFRAGRLRRLGVHYFNPALPFYARNFIFGAIPAGGIGILGSMVFPLAFLTDALWAQYAGVATVPVMLIAAVLSIAFMMRPPRWLKPAWLTRAEGRAARDQTRRQTVADR